MLIAKLHAGTYEDDLYTSIRTHLLQASGLIEKLMPSNYEDITRYSAVKQGASFNYVNTQY